MSRLDRGTDDETVGLFESASTYPAPRAESADTHTETVIRTIVCPLETSKRKRERVLAAIEQWQAIAERMADLMITFDSETWGQRQAQLNYAVQREFPEVFEEKKLLAHTAYEAAQKVSESFSSWDSNGQEGERPRFGDGSYLRLAHSGYSVTANERGYGVRLGLQPYKPEWFHLNVGDYQRPFLAALVDDDHELSQGSAEVHLRSNGSLALHLVVKHDVPVYDVPDEPLAADAALSQYLGVVFGERHLSTVVVYDVDGAVDGASAAANTSSIVPPADGSDNLSPVDGEVIDVEIADGREFRHHREQLKRRKRRVSTCGRLAGVQAFRTLARYTDQETHTATRRIIDLAHEHEPCAIIARDLTGYRESADDPIHDFPYAMLHEQLMYKATAGGLSVKRVSPTGTAATCRRCGETEQTDRADGTFTCEACGYAVASGVNTALATIGKALSS